MRKTIKIILFFIFCIILFSTIVKAEDAACKITLSADKTTVKPGDEVTINLLMEDITKPTGIIEFVTLLSISNDVFDIVFTEDDELKAELGEENCEILYNGEKDSDSTIKNPWYLMYIEESGIAGVCGATIGDPQLESQIVGKIKLKVKESAAATETKITLSFTEVIDAENIDAGTGYSIPGSEIKLQVTTEGKEESGDINNIVQNNTNNNNVNNNTNNNNVNNNTNNNTNNNNVNNNTNNNTNNNNVNNNTNNNTNKNNIKNNTNSNTNKVTNTNKQTDNKATQEVPYTGIEDWIPFIFLGMVISVIAYINYRRYKDI